MNKLENNETIRASHVFLFLFLLILILTLFL
jgi:hypothetical protein